MLTLFQLENPCPHCSEAPIPGNPFYNCEKGSHGSDIPCSTRDWAECKYHLEEGEKDA